MTSSLGLPPRCGGAGRPYMCNGKCGCFSEFTIPPSFPDLFLSVGMGNCGGRPAYGKNARGITRLGGSNFGAVATTGWSFTLCTLVGVLCGLEPADPELEDLGLLRFKGASGSEGGRGGEGVRWGGGDRFSADICAKCAVAEIQDET